MSCYRAWRRASGRATAATAATAATETASEDSAAMVSTRTSLLPSAVLLLLLLGAATLRQAAADDAEAEDRSEEGDGDGDGAEDGDGACGAGADEGDGDGPSMEEHGILALAEAVADPRSLVLGWRQYGDCLIFQQVVRRAKGFGRLHDVDVVAPRGNATITHVAARPVGDGGALRAERRGGGVGQPWLHLKLRAPRGYGLHYEVRVYGR